MTNKDDLLPCPFERGQVWKKEDEEIIFIRAVFNREKDKKIEAVSEHGHIYSFYESIAPRLRLVSRPQPQNVEWEFFTDAAYWDMCAVRHIGDKDFNSPNLFHVSNLKEGERLASLLNSLTQPQNVEGDLCHHELRMLVRRLAVRLPKDDTVRLQAEDYLRRTFKAADVLRADEHEQLFHPKPDPSGDAKEALEALVMFDGMTFNGNIEAWQKLGHLIDKHRNTIRAALIAQDVNDVDIKTGNE